MSTQQKATVEAAMKRLLTKRQRKAVIDLTGDALNHRTALQAVRYLLNLGITAHEAKIAADWRGYVNWDTQFFADYAAQNGPRPRQPGDSIIMPRAPDV